MIDHFGLLAPLYDRLVGLPDTGRLQQLLDLPTAGMMLDVGGGTGRVSLQLRKMVGNLALSDLSPAMLQQARSKGPCFLIAAHAERLPFPNDTFDRVLVVDALHHFHDQRQAIADLVRVLKPGGRLVIEEPDLNRFSVKLVALVEKLALMRSHFYYPHEIGHMIASRGLQPRIVSDGRFATWVVADKVEADGI